MNIKRHTAAAAALAAALGVAASVDSGAASADPPAPFCSLAGMATFVWNGGGDGTSWADPDNWVDGMVPGPDGYADAYVCIPEGSTVVMAAGDVATAQVVEAPSVDLTIDPGAGLFVYGDTQERTSYLGYYLEIGGALGGPGRLTVESLTIFGVFDDDITPSGSVLASDPCSVFGDLPAEVCTNDEGSLVHTYATNAYGGFDLRSGYDFVVHGALVPGDVGIGMSSGSRLVLDPVNEFQLGQMNMHADADIYPTDNGSPRPVVVNNGIIRKYRSGLTKNISVISTDYEGDGELWVEDGDQLVIIGGNHRPAELTADSELGSGPCRVVDAECRFTTLRQRGKRQSAVLQAPTSQPESQRALVEVRPRADLRRPGDLGIPYLVHADELEATALTPALIELRYDGSLLDGRTWADVRVFRQKAAGAPWRRIRACESDGTPPGTARACVDRLHNADSSRQVLGSGGDAILVVRTTVTSRWVGR